VRDDAGLATLEQITRRPYHEQVRGRLRVRVRVRVRVSI